MKLIHKLATTVISAICACFSSSAMAFTVTASANFDSLPEGFIGNSFTDGGLTFFEGVNNPVSGFTSFAVDSTSTALGNFGPKGPNFSPPNFITIGAFSPGPQGNLGASFKSARIKADSVNSFAMLDFFALTNVNSVGNTLTLQAFLNGSLVSSDSSLISDFELVEPGDPLTLHRTYSISNVSFDELRLVASGPTNNGTVSGGFDNVAVGIAAVPEPTTALSILALGTLGAASTLKRKLKSSNSTQRESGLRSKTGILYESAETKRQ